MIGPLDKILDEADKPTTIKREPMDADLRRIVDFESFVTYLYKEIRINELEEILQRNNLESTTTVLNSIAFHTLSDSFGNSATFHFEATKPSITKSWE